MILKEALLPFLHFSLLNGHTSHSCGSPSVYVRSISPAAAVWVFLRASTISLSLLATHKTTTTTLPGNSSDHHQQHCIVQARIHLEVASWKRPIHLVVVLLGLGGGSACRVYLLLPSTLLTCDRGGELSNQIVCSKHSLPSIKCGTVWLSESFQFERSWEQQHKKQLRNISENEGVHCNKFNVRWSRVGQHRSPARILRLLRKGFHFVRPDHGTKQNTRITVL